MVIKILLVISIVLQLSAASVAIGLTKVTKYNLSWILFTVALTMMAFMRFAEYINMTGPGGLELPDMFFVWAGIVTSLCFAGGLFLVHRIFKYISKADKQRQLSEKRLLNTIMRTEEKERRRFSKDLHDSLGPLLSSAKMSVSALERMSPDDPAAKEVLENIHYVVDEAVRSLKEVSANMNPHVLTNFGIARAVSNFIGRLPQSGMEVVFNTNLTTERFGEDVEAIVYRVVCELITNSLKHSGASRIELYIALENNEITVNYSDNGQGFDPKEIPPGKGMGFYNIASRVSSLKGSADIASAPGEGMEAVVKVGTGPHGTEEEHAGRIARILKRKRRREGRKERGYYE